MKIRNALRMGTYMEFNEYDKARLNTAIYPDDISFSYTALGLCGEAGEYAEKVKKYLRDGTLDKHLMAKELGDVLWYVSACAYELGFTLEDVARINLDKLAARKLNNTLQGSGDER